MQRFVRYSLAMLTLAGGLLSLTGCEPSPVEAYLDSHLKNTIGWELSSVDCSEAAAGAAHQHVCKVVFSLGVADQTVNVADDEFPFTRFSAAHSYWGDCRANADFSADCGDETVEIGLDIDGRRVDSTIARQWVSKMVTTAGQAAVAKAGKAYDTAMRQRISEDSYRSPPQRY